MSYISEVIPNSALESDLPFAGDAPRNPINVVACQVDARGLDFDRSLVQRLRMAGVRSAVRVSIGEIQEGGLVTVSFGFDRPRDMRVMRDVLQHAKVACSAPTVSAGTPVDAITHYDVARVRSAVASTAPATTSSAVDATGGQLEREPLHLGALVKCEVDARLFTGPDQIVDLLRKAGMKNVLRVYELGTDNGTVQLMIATHRPKATQAIAEALKTAPVALLDHGSITPLANIPEGARLQVVSIPELHAHHTARPGVAA